VSAWLLGVSVPVPEVLAGAVGLTCACAALVLGNRALAKRRRAKPPPPPAEKPTPEGQHDPFVQGSACERRSALRRSGRTVRVLLSDGDYRDEPFEGWVIDRSVGGLCLCANEVVQPGVRLKVMPENAPPETPWVEVEVRSVREEDGQQEIGCKFVKTPPWGILLLFG
jgi:hypothetical protein